MQTDEIYDISHVWPEWKIEKELGRGAYGVVYQAVRNDHNIESRVAIKVVSIPSDPYEIDSLYSEGLDLFATKTYLQDIVNDFVGEIRMMESLKGVPNIVFVEDYKVVEKSDDIGWDIYIRMELLTPLNSYICDKNLSEADVIKIGCDICTALEICESKNIIHRDIKPENLFVNEFGYFKLGDFGIARKMENLTSGLSQKGTFSYMAPEVATSSLYDSCVDTYSLGIVLYKLLNRNKLPFIDVEKQVLSLNDRKSAVERRIRGEQLPPPCDASFEVANVILRACAHNPVNRFKSATEMKQALMQVADRLSKADDNSNTEVSVGASASAPAYDNYRRSEHIASRTYPVSRSFSDNARIVNNKPLLNNVPIEQTENKRTRTATILVTLLIIAVVFAGVVVVYKSFDSKVYDSNEYSSDATSSYDSIENSSTATSKPVNLCSECHQAPATKSIIGTIFSDNDFHYVCDSCYSKLLEGSTIIR